MRWESEKDFRAWLADAPDEVRTGSWRAGLATGSTLMEFDVVPGSELPGNVPGQLPG